MTPLQQMAFERLENINKECLQSVPDKLHRDDVAVEIPRMHIDRLRDLLYEQQSWIEALWEEERKDGCEEMI
jgi:hypothetical protein